jgi:hypothetical protein
MEETRAYCMHPRFEWDDFVLCCPSTLGIRRLHSERGTFRKAAGGYRVICVSYRIHGRNPAPPLGEKNKYCDTDMRCHFHGVNRGMATSGYEGWR